MGAGVSSTRVGDTILPDNNNDSPFERLSSRSWREGVPFTLLHDEDFVAEKYQEISILNGNNKKNNEEEPSEMSGTNEVPLEELQQVADIARIKLFTKPQRNVSSATHKSSAQGALFGIVGNALSRDSAEFVASEKLRSQRVEIIRSYFHRLSKTIEQEALNTSSSVADAQKALQSQQINTRKVLESTKSFSAGSIFSMGSFRMQLEMLKEFRATHPSLFKNGVIAIIRTILEFPVFALRDIEPNSAEESLLIDTHTFCRELLVNEEIDGAQRDAILLMLLAFGISSGRLSLLLDFVAGILLLNSKSDDSNAKILEQPFCEKFVDQLLNQLESYKIDYSLSTFEEGTLLKQFPIKTASTSDDDDAKSERSINSITTDGSYLYIWNFKTGLSKVGTGNNFTVAGRVYAQTDASIYTQALKNKRTYAQAFYGSGKEMTEHMRNLVTNGTESGKKLRDTMLTGDLEDVLAAFLTRKLYIEFMYDGMRGEWVFEDEDEFQFPPSKWLESVGKESVELNDKDYTITFSFYGEFDYFDENAMCVLSECLSSHEENATEPQVDQVTLTPEILMQLSSASTTFHQDSDSSIVISDDKELFMRYAVHGSHFQMEKTCLGDVIRQNEPAKDVYLSSITFAGEYLYVNLLHRDAESTSAFELLKQRQEQANRPRQLIRVSPLDLSVLGVVTLLGNEQNTSGITRGPTGPGLPLFTYISEGKYIYEIEVNTFQFRVRVYGFQASSSSDDAVLLRTFDLDIKELESTPFVDYLLNLLKMELQVTAYDFQLPSFYTNGDSIVMFLPNTLSNRVDTVDCVLFDCSTGKTKEVETENLSSLLRRDPTEQKITKTNVIERKVSGILGCFDAENNLIWCLEPVKGTVSAFQNKGNRISLSDSEVLADQIPLANNNGFTANGVVKRILSFLHQIGAASIPSDAPTEVVNGEKVILFVSDLSEISFQVLLQIIQKYVARFAEKKCSIVEIMYLQASLGIMHTNIQLLLRCAMSHKKERILNLLREDEVLSKPLELLIQSSSNSSTDKKSLNNMLDAQLMSLTLDLYVTSMNIFHSDICKHLAYVLRYLEKWSNKRISKVEIKLLTRLLSHMCSRIDAVEKALCESQLNSMEEHLKHLVDYAVFGQKRRLDYQLNLTKRSGGGNHTSISAEEQELFAELISLINCITQSVFVSFATGKTSLKQVVDVFDMILDASDKILDETTKQIASETNINFPSIESVLKEGFIGVLGTMLVSCVVIFIRNRDQLAQAPVDKTEAKKGASEEEITSLRKQILFEFLSSKLIGRLLSLMKSVDMLVSLLDPEAKENSVESFSVVTKMEVIESTHEYANNLDETIELKIPGATQITITFDPKSRTEYNYDYLTFYKDKNQNGFYGQQYYSGRDEEHNWPGVGNNKPLIIPSDHCFVYFHTDSSNTDWGFKFTAVGQLLEKKESRVKNWLVFLQENIVLALDESMRLFLHADFFAPVEEEEQINQKFLQSELFKSGIYTSDQPVEIESNPSVSTPGFAQNANVVKFLQEFIDLPSNSPSEKLFHALMERSGGPRRHSATMSIAAMAAASANGGSAKSADYISVAVRAVAAAILHHNMWGMDAYAFAENVRTDVSEHLLKGWKNAQKMRDWFHLGDAADATIHRPISPIRRRSKMLRRQPSAFKGVSEEGLQILCKNVIERAKFLLELTPASFSYVSGAKRRWGLLAKYGHAIGSKIKDPSSKESPLDKWYNLLDELQAATELRSLLQYRRSSCDRMKNNQGKSVTEQVLEFIQSDADVEELRKIVRVRNRRAQSRILGLQILVQALENCSNHQLKCVVVESFAATLKRTALSLDLDPTGKGISASKSAANAAAAAAAAGIDPPRIHFDTSLSSCDEIKRQQLSDAFGNVLRAFSSFLKTIPISETSVNSSIIISILKACALDYDLDDSFLLHESRILPQILRLLSSDDVKVRRAAQSIIGVFLSRFVVGKNTGKSEVEVDIDSDSDPSAFQKQLFAAVGLQLEGVVSLIESTNLIDNKDPLNMLNTNATTFSKSALAPAGPAWLYLPENSPGLTSSSMTHLSWNHSVMLWVFVPEVSCEYALKIGDEVRRGPDWKQRTKQNTENQDEDGGDREVGVISAILSPTTIEVRWFATGVTGEYIFDPKEGVCEVILVDEGAGGVIFYKGSRNLVYDTPLATPWSHFGLFLDDKKQLSYRISCGPEKEAVYESAHALETNAWSHVCITQEEEALKLFVNGSLVSQHALDTFLLMDGGVNASESKIIESAHPYCESVDQYWPVHIPGASKIRVVFDPLSDIPRANGFVRFYKNARCDEYWGEETYTGSFEDVTRNFPCGRSMAGTRRRGGALSPRRGGQRAQTVLEIPSDRFLVYFHNEGNAAGWGFRLIASPLFADEVQKAPGDSSISDNVTMARSPYLNPYPFYFGEPPARALDEGAGNCWIYQPKAFNYSLSEHELLRDIQSSSPPAHQIPTRVPNERILHMLGLLRTCSDTNFGRNLISTPENIGNLMFLAFDQRLSIEARCGSIRVLKDLVAFLSPEIVSAQFQRMFPFIKADFLLFLFQSLAGALNVWSTYLNESESIESKRQDLSSVMHMNVSAQGMTSLISSYISLLHNMTGHFNWGEQLFNLISSYINQVESLATHLRGKAKVANIDDKIGGIIASLALFGGNYEGISIGGRVKCCVNIDGKESQETGYLVQFRFRNGSRTARVLFDCDPTRPVDVPVSDVSQLDDEEEEEMNTFLKNMSVYSSEVKQFYHKLLLFDTNLLLTNNKKYNPKISRKENVEVLESEHPYGAGEDVLYQLDFPGAEEIVIYFDKLSCTAGPGDYIRFLKRDRAGNATTPPPPESSGDIYWGESKYYGDSFPGVGNIPALRIPCASVDVHYHTDEASSAPGEWGFKLTAHAFEESCTFPPEIPPAAVVGALCDLRARSLKSLCYFLQKQEQLENDQTVSVAFPPDNKDSFISLIPSLTKLAVAPSDGRPTQSNPKSQVFESKHPYANSVLEYMSVTFRGASSLVITFDPQCRTEHGCDYLSFFKDKSLVDRWGAYQYSGTEDTGTANWPGLEGRPPLVIPSDSFTLLWCTDTSNFDWGWKFTVTAEFPSIYPRTLSLPRLDQRAYHLYEILYEKPQVQRTPKEEEFEGFAPIDDIRESDEMWGIDIGADHSRKLLEDDRIYYKEPNTAKDTLKKLVSQRRFRVVDPTGVPVKADRHDSAATRGRLKHGTEFDAITKENGWLHAFGLSTLDSEDVSIAPTGKELGWIKQRTGETLHVTCSNANRKCQLEEELLVLGVDDTRLDFRHAILKLDESNQEYEELSNFVSQFSSGDLKGQSHRFQSFAYDSYQAMAIKHAQNAIAMYVLRTTAKAPLNLNSFGSMHNFLLLLAHFYSQEKAKDRFDGASYLLDALHRRLQDFFTSTDAQDEENIIVLIKKCVQLLRKAPTYLPKGRGAVRVIESAHPYHDSMDQYWQVSIPGAKLIKIVFDPRSKSEAGCDYLCFYKNGSNRKEMYGEPQYGGRGGSENWPGCGGRPPLFINDNHFEVFFHSDSSQNDWGFKLFAIGIFEDGKEEDLIDTDDEEEFDGSLHLNEEELEAYLRVLEMCCWLLKTLTDTPHLSRSSFDKLLSFEMMEMLIYGLDHLPQHLKLSLLEVVTSIAKQQDYFFTLPTQFIVRIRDLVKAKLRAQYAAEDRVDTKSWYLQTLVQCAISLDLAIDSCRQMLTQGSSKCLWEPILAMSNACSFVEGIHEQHKLYGLKHGWIGSHNTSTGLNQWQFLVKKNSSKLIIGLVSEANKTLAVGWLSSGGIYLANSRMRFDHTFSQGDLITLELDLDRETLSVRKNHLPVAIILGPPLSGAIHPLPLKSLGITEDIQVAVGFADATDVVMVRRHAFEAPMASLPHSIDPNWYNKLVDASGIMLDYMEDRAHKFVVKESVSHPLVLEDEDFKNPENIHIPGAIALEVRFDKRSRMAENHEIVLENGSKRIMNNQKSGLSRLLTSATAENDETIALKGFQGDKVGETCPSWILSKPQKRDTLLHKGDRVVRGQDWRYADEDGGAGSIGEVVAIVPWEGRVGSAVRVKWLTNERENIYRYGYNGRVDVQRCPLFNEMDSPLIFHGDALKFFIRKTEDTSSVADKLEPEEEDDEVDGFPGSLKLNGDTILDVEMEKLRTAFSDDATVEAWLLIKDDWWCLVGTSANSSSSKSSIEMEIFRVKDDAGTSSIAVSLTESGEVRVWLEQPTATGERVISFTNELSKENKSFEKVKTGDWFHFAFVLSGSKASIYSNGSLIYRSKIRVRKSFHIRIASLSFGLKANQSSPLSPTSIGGGAPRPKRIAFMGHLCDIRLWDVSFKAEQLKSHAQGLFTEHTGASSRDTSSEVVQTSRPEILPPPAPQTVHTQSDEKMWKTVNRSGKGIMLLRSNCFIHQRNQTESSSLSSLVYYEVEVESSGKIHLGWIKKQATPSSAEQHVGDINNSIAIDLARKQIVISGSDLSEDPYEFQCRQGDFFGSVYDAETGWIGFYLNGKLIGSAFFTSEFSPSSPVHTDEAKEESRLDLDFEDSVNEMLSMGFSRAVSIEALEATKGEVAAALEWLLSPTRDRTNSLSSTTSTTNIGSTRRRSRATSTDSSTGSINRHDILVPCASLDAAGAQGLSWNFGQKPFKYSPEAPTKDSVCSVFEAAGLSKEKIAFEVYDSEEMQWERVQYRHRVQDIIPSLQGWWKLNEGTGSAIKDSSGHNHTGIVVAASSLPRPGVPQVASPRLRVWDIAVAAPTSAIKARKQLFSTRKERVTSGSASETDRLWGYKFYVIPHFKPESIARSRFLTHTPKFADALTMFSTNLSKEDQQLVKYVNKVANSKQLTVSQLLRISWAEIAPSDEELVRWPVLVEIATNEGYSSVARGDHQLSEGTKLPSLDDEIGVASSTSIEPEGEADTDSTQQVAMSSRTTQQERLGKRFALLQDFNNFVNRLLPFVAFHTREIELHDTFHKTSLASLIASQRHRIFHLLKKTMWEDALKHTQETGVSFELTLNRPKAMRHRACGKCDQDARYSLFSQAFRQLNSLDGAHFRRSDNIYYVKFLGENAEDAGGPYRETFAQYIEELHSSQLPLLLLSSNAQHNVGTGRDKWILNPGASTSTQYQMFEFLGKLMGVAVRSKQYLALKIATLVWKKLVLEQVSVDDLAAVDSMMVNSLKKMRTIDKYGVTEEMFEDIVMETFTTLSADNRTVPLKANGPSLAVTFQNRCQYADLVEQYRLHEFDQQVLALWKGLSKVIPSKLLCLFTAAEMEFLVCGTPEIDVELLEKCTEYSSCSPKDQHIIWFWQVLRNFSSEERSAFLRFVWGRSRLPASEKDFPHWFKLQSFNKQLPGTNADAYLPVAHTCFFAVEIPFYSSEKVLREKLLYAIYNCQEIDADGDSLAANQLGWEE